MSDIVPDKPALERPEILEPDSITTPRKRSGTPSIRRTVSYYEGPFLPPEVLERFEQIVPGSAAKIVQEHFTQADHRRTLETRVVDSNIEARKLGMRLGAILSGLAIVGGVVVMLYTSPAWGFGAVASGAALLATSYLKALTGQKQELAEKRKTAESIRPKAGSPPPQGEKDPS